MAKIFIVRIKIILAHLTKTSLHKKGVLTVENVYLFACVTVYFAEEQEYIHLKCISII